MFARLLIAVPLVLIATPSFAQKQGGDPPPQRVRSVVTFGDQKCPASTDPNEIVVCADGGEQYRIPKEFRDPPDEGAAAQSWTRRTETVVEVNRAVLPGSCSPIGSYGQSGCSQAAIREWYRQRADQKRKAESIP